ncbi:MAG: hypothetical protein ACLFWD_04005 [Anaerolineales bacterium]
MSEGKSARPKDELKQILESAERLGVEIDEEEALQWLTAMAAQSGDDDIVIDHEQGVFGHKVSMLDFSPEELARFRELGDLVQFGDVEGEVETALALSGSAAQSRIQTYPGDSDFFERINIIAPTREQACQRLAELIREKALATEHGEGYQLMEVKFGSYPSDLIVDGEKQGAGSPISWSPDQIKAGEIKGQTPDGALVTLTWEQAAQDPGWCKLDWVVADSIRGTLSNASNMLDVTWEAPDGSITPLDGYLDPYFQEIYLEAESIPIFSKLSEHVSPNALDDYVEQLEGEVKKYLTKNPNYGKAAKRMYNIFRLSGRYQEAAYIRELFDEPASLLYQVWSLIRTIDEAASPDSAIAPEILAEQANDLIIAAVEVLEGPQEKEILEHLLRLKDRLADPELPPGSEAVQAARAEVINLVNNFFYERLTGLPPIKEYMTEFTG